MVSTLEMKCQRGHTLRWAETAGGSLGNFLSPGLNGAREGMVQRPDPGGGPRSAPTAEEVHRGGHVLGEKNDSETSLGESKSGSHGPEHGAGGRVMEPGELSMSDL